MPPAAPTTLKDLRRRRGLTLEAVAVLAGDDLDIATISRVERGLVKPRPETVVKLSRALGMSASRLNEIINPPADDRATGDAPR